MRLTNCVVRRAVGALASWQTVFVMVAFLFNSAAHGLADSTSLTNAANPDDISLDELVNIQVDSVRVASRYEQRMTSVPASVSVVTADEMKKQGHRTLAEALRSVTGLYIADDRNYIYLGVRGFLRSGDYGSRVLMLVDGHRINDNIYDSAFFGREAPIDLDLVERIEVIRGPGSSVYGNNAFFGVVNIVTKQGKDFNGGEVSAEAGSQDSYKGRFSYGKVFKNDLEFLLSGSYFWSEGYKELYYREFDERRSSEPGARNLGRAEHSDAENAWNLFSSAAYHGLTLSGLFNARTKEIPTASYGTIFNDGKEWTGDYRAYADLKLDRDLGAESQLSGRLYYDVYWYEGHYPYEAVDELDRTTRIMEIDELLGDWVGMEWQFTSKVFDRHRIIFGTEFRQSIREHQEYVYKTNPKDVYFSSESQGSVLGVFGQAEIVILTNLTLSAG